MEKYAKFVMALLAFAGALISAGVLEGDAAAWTAAICSGVGAALVYLVPNKPTTGTE